MKLLTILSPCCMRGDQSDHSYKSNCFKRPSTNFTDSIASLKIQPTGLDCELSMEVLS